MRICDDQVYEWRQVPADWVEDEYSAKKRLAVWLREIRLSQGRVGFDGWMKNANKCGMQIWQEMNC